MFSKYHYLDHSFNVASRVFLGLVNDEIAGFCAVLPQPGPVEKLFRIHRTVVMPDYQGLGLSFIMNEYIGELYSKNKKLLCSVTTHPGLIKSRLKSDRWKLSKMNKGIKLNHNFDKTTLSKRLKVSFFYIPKGKNKKDFNILWTDI